MKFNMKRLLSFALALVLTMSLALPVAAEEDSSNVAKIGETEYATLSLALADAQNGETTITLISDIELTEALVISADVNAVLDLNGHTISQTKEQTAAYSMITNKGTLTIVDSGENGAITYVDSGNGGEYVSNTILNEGSLTVSGGTISNKSSATVATNGYPHAIDARGRVVLNGGVITCDEYSAIRIWCTETAATVEIYEGATINGAVDFHNVSNKTNIGNLIISGGTFNQTKNVNVIRVLNFGFDLSKMTGIITGGTFNGNIKIFNYSGDDAVIGDVFTVSGGYFVEVPDAVAEGYVSDVKVGDYYVVHKHNSDKELPAKAATCTEDGLTAGKACSVCGETQVPQEIVPATDHDWGYRSGVTAEGNKHWMWCRNFCGADIKEMGDHVYTHSDDLSKYRVMHETECGTVVYCLPECEVCGFDGPLAAAQKKVYKEDGEHVFDEGVVTREATCSQTGEIVYTCTYELCGFKKTEELPVIEHAWSKDFQPGTDTHWHYCTNEGCTAKKDEASHTFAEIKDFAYAVKGNECAAEFIQQCSVCGKGNPDKTFWAAAENPVHTYDDGVVTKESTCSEAGVKTYTCTNEGCGHTKTEAVEKKAHTEVLVPGKDATCTEKGLTAGKKCSVCGEVTVAQTEVAATGHKLTKVEAKEATYTAAGVKEHYTCSACSALFADAEGKTAITDVVIPQLIKVEGTTAKVETGAVDTAITDAVEKAEQSGEKAEVVIEVEKVVDTEASTDPSAPADTVKPEDVAKVVEVQLPVASIDKVVEAKADLTVVMPNVTVTMDTAALKTVSDQAAGEAVALVVEEVKKENLTVAQQKTVEKYDVAVTITAELICQTTGEKIWTEKANEAVESGSITVKLPFTPAENTNGSDYKVLFIDDDGSITEIATEFVDGHLVFALEHFSDYVVVNTAAKAYPDSPATGDNANIVLLAIVAILSVAGLAVCVILTRKNRYTPKH